MIATGITEKSRKLRTRNFIECDVLKDDLVSLSKQMHWREL